MKLPMVFAFLLSTATATSAFAACNPKSLPVAPEVPAGANATLDEMFAAQNSVHEYIELTKQHLECIDNTLRYNAAVRKMHQVADSYNSELKVFKAKQGQS